MLKHYSILLTFVGIFPCCFGRWIRSNDVPYDYLTSLLPIDGLSSYSMDRPLEKSVLDILSKNCEENSCFFAVFNRSENPEESLFQPLINSSNNCMNSSNCLNFTSSEYQNVTLIFENQQQNTGTCGSYKKIGFETPKCPDEWSAFLRTNNKTWCFRVFDAVPESCTFDQANAACRAENAYLNGIETEEEFKYFQNISYYFLDKGTGYGNDEQKTHIWVGARRNLCSSLLNGPECAQINKPYWFNTSSRYVEVNTTWGSNNRVPFDGSGNCIAYAAIWSNYDDFPCDQPVFFYSCGKYMND